MKLLDISRFRVSHRVRRLPARLPFAPALASLIPMTAAVQACDDPAYGLLHLVVERGETA